MFPDLLMFSFTYFYTFYTFQKITKQTFIHKYPKALCILSSLILASLSLLLKIYATELTYIIPLLLIWLSLSINDENPKIIIFLLISFLISYSTWAFCSFIVVFFALPFRNISWVFFSNLLSIFVGILQSLSILLLFKNKRFKNGMPFLYSTSSFNIATALALFLIGFLIYRPSIETNLLIKVFSLFPYIILLLFLIHWWQSQITKSYKRSLQLRELESLRMELAEKEKQVVELSRQNQELGRLIHKDNKLIPAMEHAVHEYFITDFATLDDAKNLAQTLLLEIEALSKNRSNIILEMNISKSKHYSTGVPSLDTLLNYMDKRARQEHINLSVHMSIDLNTYIPKAITSEDLVHVLSDLLENAIIASKDRADANIQLQFYESEKHFIIEIGDNGIPFEITSLVNFGLTQFTTHEDTGGSGIGLMDIWKIKEKYSASLHITEYEDNAPFTKKIALIFNKKNRYSISTNRKEDILQQSKRIDLQVF